MKQTIFAIIRPYLNLSQQESQAAHLIEHILASPKRLEAIGLSRDYYAKNIIYNSGVTNDFYMAEYFVVLSDQADKVTDILVTNKDNLFLNEDDFQKHKATVIEELSEYRGEYISTAEQRAKAVYTVDSPTIRNSWNDSESIKSLTKRDIENIFSKYNTDLVTLKLSWDKFDVNRIPTLEKNNLNITNNIIELSHPWQSLDSIDVSVIIKSAFEKNYLFDALYRKSLSDMHFGLLFKELRHNQGLVYDIDLDYNYGSDTIEIDYSCAKDTSNSVIEHIKKTLSNYDSFIRDNIEVLKQRLKFDIELDWGDVQCQSENIIEKACFNACTQSPSELLAQIDAISVCDLISKNNQVLDGIENKALIVKQGYGEKLSIR